jgi:DNA-binding MarR family transcriptional regulator
MMRESRTNSTQSLALPNRLVHEPARLAILTVLCSCESADFLFLRRVTGLSKGNLSVQLVNLEQAGLVVITKEIVERKMRTTVKLSKAGAAEIKEYWQAMDNIRARMIGEGKKSIGQSVAIPVRLLPSTR